MTDGLKMGSICPHISVTYFRECSPRTFICLHLRHLHHILVFPFSFSSSSFSSFASYIFFFFLFFTVEINTYIVFCALPSSTCSLLFFSFSFSPSSCFCLLPACFSLLLVCLLESVPFCGLST